MLSMCFGALLNRSDLPLLEEKDVLVHQWIMFAQHHLLSESAPLRVEEVSCPCSAHHLNQDGLGFCFGQICGGKKHVVDFNPADEDSRGTQQR